MIQFQFWENGIAYLTEVILQCWQPLHYWSDTLKSAFAHSRKIAVLKIWCQCLLFVQSYLENFLCHQAAAVPVLPTDNLSPVCRYITEIWPVLMACTWKNRVLLAAFWDKISIFHLGQTEHRSARGDGPLCAPHRALISFISWRYLVKARNQAESTEQSRFPPPNFVRCRQNCWPSAPTPGHTTSLEQYPLAWEPQLQ